MNKPLKILLAVAAVLLALAVALLIYLEMGKQDVPQPTETPDETTSSTIEETDVPQETTAPVETEFVPETQEGGMPIYPFEPDTDSEEPGESNTGSEAPGESAPDATEESYVPDEDELPQMPL